MKRLLNISDEIKTKIFFVFYFVFFFVVFIIIMFFNKNEAQECNNYINDYDKYSFRHEIEKEDKSYVIFGDSHNNEKLFTLRYEGVDTIYFEHYNDLYRKNNEKFYKYNYNLIENFDFKLINKNYVFDTINENIKDDFDYLKNPSVEVGNIVFELFYKDRKLDYIKIKKGNTTITSYYKEDNLIKSFDINLEDTDYDFLEEEKH